jgi:hypothetical protein
MNNDEIDKILFGFGVDSFNRFETFLKIKSQLKGENYWYALRSSYQMSDNLFRFSNIIKNCFLSDEPKKDLLMDFEEYEYINNLPNQITIYRGMSELELKQESFGCSWSLKKSQAIFFANEYNRNFDTRHLKKVVHEITIDKSKVMAFFNSREEFEIIYFKENY